MFIRETDTAREKALLSPSNSVRSPVAHCWRSRVTGINPDASTSNCDAFFDRKPLVAEHFDSVVPDPSQRVRAIRDLAVLPPPFEIQLSGLPTTH